MNAIERAEELRQDAIKLLLTEQEVLGEKLLQLGYDQENSPVVKRRGRRPKAAVEPDAPVNDALLVERVDLSGKPLGSPAQPLKDRAQ